MDLGSEDKLLTKKDSNISRATPVGILRYAFEYYAAAKATDDAIGDDEGYEIHAHMVVNFLIGQSIELALKAFLLHCSIKMEILKLNPYRHDLVYLFESAIKNELINDTDKSQEIQLPKIREMIQLLCGPYKKR